MILDSMYSFRWLSVAIAISELRFSSREQQPEVKASRRVPAFKQISTGLQVVRTV